jgi:multimeric flavodoxin WrbA
MSPAILDGTTNENPLENILKERFRQISEPSFYFKLRDMNILPCRSCGSCGIRTPGLCVIKDEMPEVMRAIAQSYYYVLLTPIRFGGYSSQLKKAIDRMMSLGLPFYMVKKGHLLHPMRYGTKLLIGIGIAEEGCAGEEEENFRLLVARNGLNMQCDYRTLVFRPGEEAGKIGDELDRIIKEAGRK